LSTKCSLKDLINRKTLILGDVGTGKTRLTARLLREASETEGIGRMTVIDMAPDTIIMRGQKFGGCLREVTGNIEGTRFLEAHSNAPRLTAKSPKEILKLVEENVRKIEVLLREYLQNPTEILVINDISIYLQSGELGLLPDLLEVARTFIANGYFGEKLSLDQDMNVSEKEREEMVRLKQLVDRVILLE